MCVASLAERLTGMLGQRAPTCASAKNSETSFAPWALQKLQASLLNPLDIKRDMTWVDTRKVLLTGCLDRGWADQPRLEWGLENMVATVAEEVDRQ